MSNLLKQPALMKKRKHLFTYIGLALLLLSVPITIFIVQRRQQLRSGAQGTPGEYDCYQNIDLAIAMDMSKTMEDPIAPGGITKRQASINFAKALMDTLDFDPYGGKGDGVDRVTVIEFNDNADIKLNLTNDKNAIYNALDNLQTHEYSNIAAALNTTATALSTATQPKKLIIFSDGAYNPPPTDPCWVNGTLNLGCLNTSANNLKATGVEITAFHFRDINNPDYINDIGYQYLKDRVVSLAEGYGPLVFPITYEVEGFLNLMLELWDILTRCPCPYVTDLRIESLDSPGTVLNASTNEFLVRSTIYGNPTPGNPTGESVSAYDLAQVTPLSKAQIYDPAHTWNLPWNVMNTDTNKVELTHIPGGYYVAERFCIDNNPQAPGCPTSLAGTEAITGQPDTGRIDNFRFTCNANITYGWRIKEHTCPYSNTVEIRDTAGNIVPVTGFWTKSIIADDPTASGPIESNALIYNDTDNLAHRDFTIPYLSEGLREATDISVTISQTGPALGYRIVNTFCEDGVSINAPGCPYNGGTNTPTLRFDALACDLNFTYGWIVERIPTDALCHNFVCRDKESLISSGIALDNLIPCEIGEIGTPDDCGLNVCNLTTDICENKAVENITTEVACSDFGVDIGQLCSPPKNVCEGVACIRVENRLDPRYNNRPCTTVTAQSDECSATYCVGTGPTATCEPFPIDSPPTSQPCTVDEDCRGEVPTDRHTECDVNDRCVIVPTSGDSQCENDKDCLQSYWACDTGACVEIFGDQPTTATKCVVDAPVDGCLCKDYIDQGMANICLTPEDPQTGTEGAALLLTLVTLGLLALGMKLLY